MLFLQKAEEEERRGICEKLETKLQMLRNDGSLKELSEKYFGTDISQM